MRLPLRSLSSLVLAVAVATCSDAPSAASRSTEGLSKGLLSFAPVFSETASAVLAQRTLFAGVTFDHVRIMLVRPPSETVRDTSIAFTPDSPPQTLELAVQVLTIGEVFDAVIDFTNDGSIVFHGQAKLKSHAPEQAPPQQEIVLQYVGVGANATKIIVSPKTLTIQAPNSASFTATAADANGNAVDGVPLSWSSSDPTVATIDANSGLLNTTGKRGTATITARTPTGVSDNASLTVTLAPTGITLVSGGSQTGKVGTALGQPGVVRVVASDGSGVPGVTVNFAAPEGGAVGSSSVTTGDDGQASTTLTLGGVAGPQSFAAAAGAFNVSIPATATPGDPTAVVAFSGSGQQDTVKKTLKQPFVAKVTDSFGNGVPNVTVTWARTSGTGTLAGTSSTTGAEGTASIGYTLGEASGTETVTATAAGVSTAATFTATALSTIAADIVAVSGGGQSGRVSQPLGAPFVVRVVDVAGAPVSGAAVAWTAVNGSLTPTTTTDATGQSSNTMTLGRVAGVASATASITTPAGARTVRFNVTAQPGIVAQIAFRRQPATATVGLPMTPPVQVALLDAAGNLTAASNTVTIALGANPGDATLGGIVTRAASGGIATFDSLTVSQVASGYTLVASSAGVADRTSLPFDAIPGVGPPYAIGLVDGTTFEPFVTSAPPVIVAAGVGPINPPAIKVTDTSGIGVPNTIIEYTVSRSETVIFSGTATTNAQGIVTYASLLISSQNLQVAGEYIFTARLPNVETSPVDLLVTVVPAAPVAVAFGGQFPTGVTAGATMPIVTVGIVDQYGNVVSNATENITLTITAGTGASGAVLSGATVASPSGGVVIFSNLSINLPGTYSLTASAPGRAPAVSPTFVVSPPPPPPPSPPLARLDGASPTAERTAGEAATTPTPRH